MKFPFPACGTFQVEAGNRTRMGQGIFLKNRNRLDRFCCDSYCRRLALGDHRSISHIVGIDATGRWRLKLGALTYFPAFGSISAVGVEVPVRQVHLAVAAAIGSDLAHATGHTPFWSGWGSCGKPPT